jgi:hypothetical protein
MGFLSDIFDFAFGWLVPDVPKAEIGIDVTKANTDANIPILYGRGYGSGLLVYQATNDNDDDDIKNDLLHQIVVWGEGHCGGITTNFVDDEQSSSSRFTLPGGRVYHAVNFPNGITIYNDPLLVASGKRTTDTYNGKLVSYIRSEMVPDVWQGQPDHKAEWKGRRISTPSGGAATSSENPISQLYDLLKSPIYGKALTTDKLVVSSFQSERPICDTLVETFSGSGVNRKLFTSNVSLDTSNTVIDNVNTLLKACRGMLFHSDGKLKVLIEKDDEPVDFTLDEKEIGFVSWGKITNSNKSNRYNRVICRYTDPESGWTKQEAIYPAPGSEREAELLAEDNGVLLEKSITLDTCIYYNEAHKHASTILEVSRQQLRSSVIWGPEASILEVGDILPAYRAASGWAGKLFRIESVEKSLSTGEVSLRLREHQPYIYDDQNTGDKPELPDTTIAYNRPATPTNLSSTDVYDEFTQVNIAWTSTTTDHQVIILDNSDVQIINTGVAGKLYSVKQLEVGNYTINVYAVGGLGRKSLVASLDFSIAAKITYIWYVYADDDQGTGISLSPVDKAFFGIVAGQRSPTVSIADPDIFDYYTNPDGSQGLPGKDGESGQTSYLHIAYANNSSGSSGFSVSDSANKTYIGQYTDFTQADSTDNTDYNWTLIKGEDGVGGFTLVNTANCTILGNNITKTSGGSNWNAGAYSLESYTTCFASALFLNAPRAMFGLSKDDGNSSHFNTIDYAVYANGDTFSNGDNLGVYENGSDKGTFGNFSSTDILSIVNDGKTVKYFKNGISFYTSLNNPSGPYRFDCSIDDENDTVNNITFGSSGSAGGQGVQGLQGEDGEQGIRGPNGSNGTSSYFHIAYADTSSGGGFSQSPTNKEYIGTYVDSNPSDAGSGSSLWNWQLVKGSNGSNGQNGTPGTNGATGQTSYLHIAYATNSNGSSGFSVSDSANKTYIGQYTDFTLADSTDRTRYSWTLIKGDQGNTGPSGAQGTPGNTGPQGPEGPATNARTYGDSGSSSSTSGGFKNLVVITIPAGTWRFDMDIFAESGNEDSNQSSTITTRWLINGSVNRNFSASGRFPSLDGATNYHQVATINSSVTYTLQASVSGNFQYFFARGTINVTERL